MAIAFKAMGVACDQDIVQLVGNEEEAFDAMSPCLEECHRAQVFTSLQVIRDSDTDPTESLVNLSVRVI